MAKAPGKRTRLAMVHTKLRRNGEWDRLMAVWPTKIKSVRRSDAYAMQPEESVAEEAWRLTLADNDKLTAEEKRLLERNQPAIPKTGDNARAVVQPSNEQAWRERIWEAAKGRKATEAEEFRWANEHLHDPWSKIDPATVPSRGAFNKLEDAKTSEKGKQQFISEKYAAQRQEEKKSAEAAKFTDDNRPLQEVIRNTARVHIESMGLTGNVTTLNANCEECGASVQVLVHSIAPVTLAQEEEVQVA